MSRVPPIDALAARVVPVIISSPGLPTCAYRARVPGASERSLYRALARLRERGVVRSERALTRRSDAVRWYPMPLALTYTREIGGEASRLRARMMDLMADGVCRSLRETADALSVPVPRAYRALYDLRRTGAIELRGDGRGSRWVATDVDEPFVPVPYMSSLRAQVLRLQPMSSGARR
jgi:predicted transcriptional regulator